MKILIEIGLKLGRKAIYTSDFLVHHEREDIWV